MKNQIAAFIDAACVPLEGAHVSGDLEQAEALLAEHPDLPAKSIHAAAALGDARRVNEFLALDRANALAKDASRSWDPLTCLCFSRYLRLDRDRTPGFVDAARALLDAGADPNTGWLERSHEPAPVFESVLYGAAGVAHNAEVTRLLLERGADPNDDETPYHAPEDYDNDAMQAVVASGRVNADNLAMMLLRKADWHDQPGIEWLLAHGADPNRTFRFRRSAFHHSILRDNALPIIEAFLDGGADPAITAHLPEISVGSEVSGTQIAAHRGRGDLLELFIERGFSESLYGLDRLVAACARGNVTAAAAIASAEPAAMQDLIDRAGKILCDFAGNGNVDGLRALLELGLDVSSRHPHGDGYFGIAPDSTPLHVASWRARHAAVRLLIDNGADPGAIDARGRTPLDLAIKACVDSYWANRRSTESMEALLEAGASPAGIPLPTGYADADTLLERFGARAR
jgi:ankyrin repeat protein